VLDNVGSVNQRLSDRRWSGAGRPSMEDFSPARSHSAEEERRVQYSQRG